MSSLKARLSHYLKLVQRGEEVIVLDRQTPIAKLVRITRHAASESAVLQRLTANGSLRAPTKKLNMAQLFRDVPKSTASVVSALLADRDEAL